MWWYARPLEAFAGDAFSDPEPQLQRSRMQVKILKPIPIQFLRQRSCYHMLSYVIIVSIVFIVIPHFSSYFCCFFLRKASFSRRGTLLGDRQRWAGLSGTWSVMNHKYGLMVYTTTYIYICMYTHTTYKNEPFGGLTIFIHLQSSIPFKTTIKNDRDELSNLVAVIFY